MFDNFGVEVSNILKQSEEERYMLKHPYVGTEHLLLAILKCNEDVSIFLKDYDLTYERFKKELTNTVGNATNASPLNLYTPLLKRVINNSLENAKERNNGLVTAKELLLSLLEEGEGIAIRILVSLNIDIDKIYDEMNKNNKITNKKLEIYETGVILNNKVSMDEVVVGRDREIEYIIETLLRRKKNNPILIGDAGVGKTAIVEELVRRIEKKDVPDSLINTKIVSLEMGNLVAGTKYRGEFEEKLTKIIKELENSKNIIIFIDEIHAMVNAGGAEGAITAGDIFKPALARGNIKCIGATTKDEYLKSIANDKALMRRFETIEILEPTKEETKEILMKVKKEYENHHNVLINEKTIDRIIYYTDKFIKNKKNPDKALEFLDSVCAKVKTNSKSMIKMRSLRNGLERLIGKKEECIKKGDYECALKVYEEESKIKNKLLKYKGNQKNSIKETDILEVLENKTNLVFTKNKLRFLNRIKTIINDELFDVEKYVDEIDTLIKDNLDNKRGFLKVCLEGEEALGKSSIVNLIGENYPRCNYIKVDLKEYSSANDVNKLIGIQQGFIGYNDKHILSSLKNNTFSIVLFDHFNMAHKIIKELIVEILKNGVITDNKGEKIYFNNTFIFITNDTRNNSKIGFSNTLKNKVSELNGLVDKVIYFQKLDKKTLNNYLEKLNVSNKEKVISLSDYENLNYKLVNRLIEEEKNIMNYS